MIGIVAESQGIKSGWGVFDYSYKNFSLFNVASARRYARSPVGRPRISRQVLFSV